MHKLYQQNISKIEGLKSQLSQTPKTTKIPVGEKN